ncbi:zinc finger protein 816-like [Trichoplusia ni]|uniref:Zinc finger protein 816-like n=1 Tax=Trichoplusia ni TaxID=7111 RepID=A0A7E5V9C2_TRINI|nr:zinc finger protein 816-like [Trichoplusia ni]
MTSLLLLKSMLFANALQKTKKKKKTKNKNMSKIKKGTFTMCRICNDEKGNIPIFNNIVTPDLPEEIKNFSGVIVSKTDNLSKTMCQNCLDLLNGCIMFRDICRSTNEKLIQLSIQKVSEISIKPKNCKTAECAEGSETVWVGPPKVEPTKDLDTTEGDSSYLAPPEPPDPPNAESEDDYNIPSPVFSEDTDQSIWTCMACHQGFNDMESYSHHLKICNSQTAEERKPPEEVTKRKFLCDICGKTTSANASLQIHMGTHENVFPFKCDVCPYQGRTVDLLRVHKRSHLAEKPYKCPQCPKATTTASNLAKHTRQVHSSARPYKCTYCDKAFSYQHDMKRHVKDIHLRQGTVECEICYKKFNTKKILQGHRWKVHKIKGIRQGRLPSYLQYQMVEQENENNEVINDGSNECEAEVERCQKYDNEEKQ